MVRGAADAAAVAVGGVMQAASLWELQLDAAAVPGQGLIWRGLCQHAGMVRWGLVAGAVHLLMCRTGHRWSCLCKKQCWMFFGAALKADGCWPEPATAAAGAAFVSAGASRLLFEDL